MLNKVKDNTFLALRSQLVLGTALLVLFITMSFLFVYFVSIPVTVHKYD